MRIISIFMLIFLPVDLYADNLNNNLFLMEEGYNQGGWVIQHMFIGTEESFGKDFIRT